MTDTAAEIERGRVAPRGNIPARDDLLWEAYLRVHNHAERLGLLKEDTYLHDLLDERLRGFEEKYGVQAIP